MNPEHVPLTQRGLEQAEAAREALAGVELDLVVSSDLPRTAETAAIVAPGHEVERWPEFSEWRGGRLDALPPEELEPLFVGALRVTDEDARFLGGESLGEALDRIHPALDRLVAREWDTALAVFHGGVNRIIISYALSGDRTYFGTFEQAPACINVLDLGDDGWIVRTVNYVPYDPLHPARTTTMEHLWEELRGTSTARRARSSASASSGREVGAADHRPLPHPLLVEPGRGERGEPALGHVDGASGSESGFQRKDGTSYSGSPSIGFGSIASGPRAERRMLWWWKSPCTSVSRTTSSEA